MSAVVQGQCGLCLMPYVHYRVERVTGEGWQLVDTLPTVEQAKALQSSLHLPVSCTRIRPVVLR